MKTTPSFIKAISLTIAGLILGKGFAQNIPSLKSSLIPQGNDHLHWVYLGLTLIGAGVVFYGLSKKRRTPSKPIRFKDLLAAQLLILFMSSLIGLWTVDAQFYPGPTLIQTETNTITSTESSILDINPENIVIRNEQIVLFPELYPTELQSQFLDLHSISASFHLIFQIGVSALGLFGLIGLFWAWGHLLQTTLSKKTFAGNPLENTLTAIALGLITIGTILFAITWAGVLSTTTISLIGGLSFIGVFLKRKSLWKAGKALLNAPLPAMFNTPLGYGLLLIGFLFTSWNFIQTAVPFPSGFDDYIYYANLPNLLAHTGELITGKRPYAFALLQSLSPLILGASDMTLALLLTGSFGVLSSLGIYAILRRLSFTPLISGLIATTSLTLPTIWYHSHIDLKVEMPLLFLASISVLLLQRWKDKPHPSLLIILGTALAFGILTKLSFVLIAAVILTLLIHADFKMAGLVTAIGGIGIGMITLGQWVLPNTLAIPDTNQNMLLVLALAPLLLGGLWIATQQRHQILPGIRHQAALWAPLAILVLPWMLAMGTLFHNDPGLSHFPSYDELGIDANTCEATVGATSDYGKFNLWNPSSSPLKNILLWPWRLTFESSLLSPANDVSPLFLAFMPLWLWLMIKPDPTAKDRKTWGALAVLFIIAWLLTANQVLWYGIAGAPLLFIGLAWAFDTLQQSQKPFRWGMMTLIALWLIPALIIRANWFTSRNAAALAYQAGIIDQSIYLENKFPGFTKTIPLLNSNPESVVFIENNAFLKFFVDNNHKRTQGSHYLSTFKCLHDNWAESPEKIEDVYQAAGIEYLVLNSPLFDPNFGEGLYETSLTFVEFAKTHFEYLGETTQFILFKIPQATP